MNFFPGRWKKQIRVKFNPDYCTFPDQAEDTIEHCVSWINHASGLDIVYIGRTTADPYPGTFGFTVGFLPPKVFRQKFTDAKKNHWAYTTLNWDFTGAIFSAVCAFNNDRTNTPARFAGILLHEIFHGLGIKHCESHYSIMNSEPYLDFARQGTPKLADLMMLKTISPGLYRGECSAYDYGDPGGEIAVIHIPAIYIGEECFEVTLDAIRDEGHWYLLSTRMSKHSTPPDIPPAATFDKATETTVIPVCYRGSMVVLHCKTAGERKLRLVKIS